MWRKQTVAFDNWLIFLLLFSSGCLKKCVLLQHLVYSYIEKEIQHEQKQNSQK